MFCAKIIAWSIVVKKGTNTLFVYIFKYGFEWSAESMSLFTVSNVLHTLSNKRFIA